MSRGRRIVLLVEDSPDLRDYFHTVLRQEGYEVRPTSDGLQALRAVEEMRPDLVVLDLQLPRISGLDVLDELGAHVSTHDVPVIVVTATDLVPTHRNVKCLLRKPVTADTLLANIERCLGGAPV